MEGKIIRIKTDAPAERQPDVRPLWPELVEEDFDESVGILERYASRLGAFSLSDLEDHFAANDVLLPETNADWRGLFAELKQAVIDKRINEGREQTWSVPELVGQPCSPWPMLCAKIPLLQRHRCHIYI